MKPHPSARQVRVFASILLFIWFGTARAQLPTNAQLIEKIDAIAKTALRTPVAGMSVAVARDGQPVLTRAYGLADLGHSVPVSAETVFHIASISKNIEAALILQLAEQGKLSLDDDVTKYVPEAPTHGRHVTVRQLLNHTSGIFSFTSLPDADQNERLDLNHDQVLALFKNKPPVFEPGTSWRYNNGVFYLAGMVVERVTHRDYAIYVRDQLFVPLGMNSAQLRDAQSRPFPTARSVTRQRMGASSPPPRCLGSCHGLPEPSAPQPMT